MTAGASPGRVVPDSEVRRNAQGVTIRSEVNGEPNMLGGVYRPDGTSTQLIGERAYPCELPQEQVARRMLAAVDPESGLKADGAKGRCSMLL